MKAIVAISRKNRVVGKNGTIPWRNKDDLRFFKQFTLNKSIIVGRKTFENLPQLPNRNVLVLTSFAGNTITNAFGLSGNIINKPTGFEDAIIAGGPSVYKTYLPYISELYVTYIHTEYDGDTYLDYIENQFPVQETIQTIQDGIIIKYSKAI